MTNRNYMTILSCEKCSESTLKKKKTVLYAKDHSLSRTCTPRNHMEKVVSVKLVETVFYNDIRC